MPLSTGRPGVECQQFENFSFYKYENYTPHSVIATSKPANPDYSFLFLYGAAADLLTFRDLVAAALVVIGSYAGGGNTLNYEIDIDGVLLKTGTLSTAGSKGTKCASEVIVEATPTIPADVLMELYLWVNAGSCSLSAAQMIVCPGCLAATGYAGLTINAFPGSVMIDFSIEGYDTTFNDQDTLEMCVQLVGANTLVVEQVSAIGSGWLTWPPTGGADTIAAMGSPVPANTGVYLCFWNNDGPLALFYFVVMWLTFFKDV